MGRGRGLFRSESRGLPCVIVAKIIYVALLNRKSMKNTKRMTVIDTSRHACPARFFASRTRWPSEITEGPEYLELSFAGILHR